MVDIRGLADKVGQQFAARARNQFAASVFLKVILVLAALMVAVAQCLMFDLDKQWPTAAYFGIPAAIVMSIASLFFAVFDRDSSEELETARQAVALAQQATLDADEARRSAEEERRFYAELSERVNEEERAAELYQAMFLMRGVLERAVDEYSIDQLQIIQTMVNAASRSLIIALGFRMAEHYTLCVYKAETDLNNCKTTLRCVAHDRTIDCPIGEARLWPAGVGVAGAAYSRVNEIVVPDLTAIEIGSLYGANQKDGDSEKYKSIAAVPILIGESDTPWGVVTATSDREGHFSLDDEPSVQTVEGVRALAAMTSLAVKLASLRNGGNLPQNQGNISS